MRPEQQDPALALGLEAQASSLGSPWPWWLGRHPLLALTATLIVWGLIDVRSRGRIEPDNLVEHRTDFTVYTAAGAACFDGRDPYAVTNARGWGYLYPPLLAILVAPLATLDPEWQVTVWFFVSLLLLWGCYRESALLVDWLTGTSLRHGVRDGGGQSHFAVKTAQNWDSLRPPDWLPWAAAIAAALPTLNCLQRGQVGVLQLYLLLVGLRLVVIPAGVRRDGAAGGGRFDLGFGGGGQGDRCSAGGLAFGRAVRRGTRRPAIGRMESGVSPCAEFDGRTRRRFGAVAGAGAGGGDRLAAECRLPARWCSLVPTKAIDTGSDLFAGDSYSVRQSKPGQRGAAFGQLDRRGCGRPRREPAAQRTERPAACDGLAGCE